MTCIIASLVHGLWTDTDSFVKINDKPDLLNADVLQLPEVEGGEGVPEPLQDRGAVMLKYY